MAELPVNFVPSAIDGLAESAASLTGSVNSGMSQMPIIGNAALCADSLYTTGRAGINFYCSTNPVAKVFFGASYICGIIGVSSAGTAIVSSFAGIPAAAWFGSISARGLNRLGKYSLNMANVTNGNITNVTEISNLMS